MRSGKKIIRLTIIREGMGDKILFPNNSEALKNAADGYKADQIRLVIDFDETDINNLIEFFNITKYCFQINNP